MTKLYVIVTDIEDIPVNYVGCHPLKWFQHNPDGLVGFREATEEDIMHEECVAREITRIQDMMREIQWEKVMTRSKAIEIATEFGVCDPIIGSGGRSRG